MKFLKFLCFATEAGFQQAFKVITCHTTKILGEFYNNPFDNMFSMSVYMTKIL